MNQHLYLGLDVGTQGTKGMVIDLERSRVIARATRSYGLLEGLPPGAAEQDPETWWSALREVVHEITRSKELVPERLAGIGVSGQQHGFVPLDARGQVIRPAKLWCDTSTAAEARELSIAFGRNVPAGFTASKILWMKRREPRNFARLATVLLPHDYVNFRLTGKTWMEAGDASGTGFFDLRERRFALDEVSFTDHALSEKLPPIVAADEPAGELSGAAAKELGLPQGIPIAPGGGDNMMSAIGSGAVRPGVCVLSLGTSATVFTFCDRPISDPGGRIATFCDSTGGWLTLLCVMNATGVAEEVHQAFSATHDLDRLTQEAERVPIGCDGVLFLPYLLGERVPSLPEATGSLLGLRPGSLKPGRLFRAGLEGTSLNIAWGVDRMRSLGLSISGVNVVGGGSKNRLWLRILSAALEVSATPLEESESAALGAALQAAWVVGRGKDKDLAIADVVAPWIRPSGEPIEPDPEASARYRELGERFREQVRWLYGAVS